MKSSNFKFQISAGGDRWSAVGRKCVLMFLFLLLAVYCSLLTASAHNGEDHSKDAKTNGGGSTSANSPAAAGSIVAAERNLQTEAGEFNVVLRRSPNDPRAGERVQFLVRFAEKIEGGFGASEPAPLENAAVSVNITQAGGTIVAENLSTHAEGNGMYHAAYAFQSSGDYKIVFNVKTADNRIFSVDFPVAVARAPVNSSFLIGLALVSLLTFAALGAIFYAAKRREGFNYKKSAPFVAAAILIFALATAALIYFLPPRQTRSIAEIPLDSAASEAANALDTSSVLTVTKESQMLFGIKTETVAARKITGGLKTTGTVRARPEARAVVAPIVAGRIFLRENLTLGSAVGRGEQLGYVEQILDVSGQTELESQRLEVAAQEREVEAKRLEIKNSVLQLQAQQSAQKAIAQQARTRLGQAQRELTRAENLLEAGAAPRRRVEEAQTAVRVAEQEIASADEQVKLLGNQIRQTSAGQNVYRTPRINQPTRRFPLTAPVTGTITEIKAASGQILETGAEILSIVNLSTVLIEAQVFERDLPAVRESTGASFTNAALEGEVYTIGTADGDGRLVSVGQTVNEQTRAVSVTYEMKNPLERLRDGMFVEVTIDTSGEREVLAVSKQAVVNEQGQTFVFVFDGGETFEKRAVALGAEGADYYEITQGLKTGERVVVEGIYQLRSTQPAA